MLANQLHLSGGFWSYAGNFDINRAGFVIAAMFAAIWALALGIWRYGRIEDRWEASAARHRGTGEEIAA